jgi:hypothetical protein
MPLSEQYLALLSHYNKQTETWYIFSSSKWEPKTFLKMLFDNNYRLNLRARQKNIHIMTQSFQGDLLLSWPSISIGYYDKTDRMCKVNFLGCTVGRVGVLLYIVCISKIHTVLTIVMNKRKIKIVYAWITHCYLIFDIIGSKCFHERFLLFIVGEIHSENSSF